MESDTDDPLGGGFDKGALCRHFHSPDECSNRCLTCGHLCGEHRKYECEAHGCRCLYFSEYPSE